MRRAACSFIPAAAASAARGITTVGDRIVHRPARHVPALDKLDGPSATLTARFAADVAAAPAAKPAFTCAASGKVVKYGDIMPRIAAVAAVLYHDFGVRRGQRVCLLAPNTPDYPCVFHAILSLGATVSTANSLFTPYELARQLTLADAAVVVTIGHFMPVVTGAIEQLKQSDPARAAGLRVLETDKPLRDGVDPVPATYDAAVTPDDLAVLPFSSGTTGLPKGVQLTHRNLVANIYQTQDAVAFVQDDVMLSVLPFFHIYGMVVIMHSPVHAGASQVTFPRFDMEAYLDALAKHKASLCFVAPPIIVGFVKHPKTRQIDTGSVRWVFSGAAPLTEEVQRLCEPIFPNANVGQGYGLTETSPVLSISPTHDIKYGSAGTLVSHTEARVVRVNDDGTGTDVGVDEEGELWVRGPQVMKGYLRQEDTDIVMPPNQEGYFRTGDLVKIDKDGHLTVTDRLKELIKYKGYQIAPAELEGVLQSHPLVQETIVIGVEHKEFDGEGEVPKAHVVLKPGVAEKNPNAKQEILDWMAERVAPYKRLRGGLDIVGEIPKTASGKLLRRVVRDQERARQQQQQ